VKPGSEAGTESYTGQEMTVVSLKPKPSNFDQASHVKAIGNVAGGNFVAQDLLVKCPSKYQGVEKKAETAASPGEEATAGTQAGLAAFRGK
jgi:cytochrome c-type biogenesis protein CcmE